MKKALTLLLICLTLLANAQSSWNMNLLGSFDYETNHNTKCNDIWGWEDGSGNEYALVGLENGFSCVDVTNPSSPAEMFFISDINSTWRDIKTWGDYAYITTEANAGLLIVDLTDLSGNTSWHVSQFTNPTTGASISFTSAHNIYIDENGVAYIFGARNNGSYVASGGAVFLDVNANATSPEYLGEWAGQYIHDGMARGDTMYAGCIYAGELFVVDVSNKSNPQTLGSISTPNTFTHNAWVSDDGSYVFTTDETSDAYLAAYDISNVNNIQEVDRIQSNPGSNSIPHNTHVDGNFLITSYYRDGTTVHDITYPNHMIQVAYYDSYAGSGNGFNGCWGTYPFLSSGNIISSDRDSYNGKGVLNIYGRAFQQACYLMGNVVDGINGNNIASADVTILSTTTSTQTNIVGNYQTAVVDSGTYQLVFSATSYTSDTITVLLTNGVMTIQNAFLYPPCNTLNIETNQNVSICDSAFYIVGNSTYTTSGSYTDTLQTTYGCDSIVNTNLTISSSISISNYDTICDGQSILVGVNLYNQSGVYIDILTSSTACDSTITTYLTVFNSFSISNPQTICLGDSIVVGNNVYYNVGIYTDSLQTINGCDSVINTTLTVLPESINTLKIEICAGDSVVIGNSTYTLSGTYTDILTNSYGCDSIIITDLTVSNPVGIIVANGIQLNVSASGGVEPYIYEVFGPNGLIISSNNNNGGVLIVNPTLSGQYYFIATDTLGCESSAVYDTINFPLGIESIKLNRKLLNITDLLGCESIPQPNVPLFYRYDDGKVEKRIIIE